MNINELKEILKKTEFELFCLECKDRWDSRDYTLSFKLNDKIRQLKNEIKALS